MEIEPRIAKQLQNYRGKGMEGGKKSVFASFFGRSEESRVRGKKSVLGHPVARATSYCLLPDTF